MPTNVTPEYKKAESAFRKAREPAERLAWLKEMLRTIPKHKGTEHLQADIKTRIKDLTEQLAGPKKGGARTGPIFTVRPEGAAQVALVGPPNSGKSSLHARLTGSQAEIGPYPHTTQVPLPGMFPYEDIHFQLLDLPPISASFMVPLMPNALQLARATLLVIDLKDPDCVENVTGILQRLDQKRITLLDDWGGRLKQGLLEPEHDTKPLAVAPASQIQDEGEDGEETEDPFRVFLPTILLASKCDLGVDHEEIEALAELTGVRFPSIPISIKTGQGLSRIGQLLFQGLGVVRVYTKIPGHPPDTQRPFTVFQGDTVYDVARLVHRDIAESLKFARVWGSSKFEGQQIGKDHTVSDGDVLELHS
jgi:ribosome-interacting GTPase 1